MIQMENDTTKAYQTELAQFRELLERHKIVND